MAYLFRALLSFAVASAALAQQTASNPAADGVIKVNVQQVLVPVVVTDKKGRAVSGLRAADFQIAEDGVPQDIVAFTREIIPSAGGAVAAAGSDRTSTSGVTSTTAAPVETQVICFDALHTSPADFVRARDAIERSLGSAPGSGQRFVLLSIGRQLHVLQPATNDASLIRAKVDSKAFTSLPAESISVQLSTAVNDVRRQMDLHCTRCPCGRDVSNRKSTCDVERQQIAQGLEARSEQFRTYDDGFFAQLNSVIAELAKLDGRRSLILVSDGFSLMPGRELFAAAGAYLPNSPYFADDPARSMQSVLERSLKIASADNIMVSAIDARGMYTPGARPGGVLDASNAAPGSTGRQEVLARTSGNTMRGGTLLEDADSKWSSVQIDNGSALSQLAKATGGVYFHDNNDLQKGIREALDDRRETYVLAYAPKNLAQDGKFRQITVTVDGGKGGVTVRAKAGYWAEGGGEGK